MTGLRWLASYPRSGNTWTRLLIDSLRRGGAPVDINRIEGVRYHLYRRALFDDLMAVSSTDLSPRTVLSWRPAMLRALRRDLTAPCLVKCHDMRHQLPGGDWTIPADVTLGAVYLVRDPRDVAVSLARMTDTTIDEAIAIMETPDRMMSVMTDRHPDQLVNLWGSWSQNVESWLAPHPFRAHVVRYEDLRRDTRDVFAAMLPALGLAGDPATVDAAVAATDLSDLRRQELAKGFSAHNGRQTFFGPGRVAGWRGVLTAAQSARIEAAHGAVMQRLGYLP